MKFKRRERRRKGEKDKEAFGCVRMWACQEINVNFT